MWAVVLGAAAVVVGLAVVKGRGGVHALEGKEAPQVTLALLEGRPLPLAGERGKVVMLDFWATWCAPCRRSMPAVQRIWRDYTARGVQLYAVNTDVPHPSRAPNIQGFLAQVGVTVPVAIDGDSGAAQNAFGVASLPTLVVIGRDGKVAFTHVGTFGSTVERELRATLDAAVVKDPL